MSWPPIEQLVEEIKSGKRSAVDLTKECLERIEEKKDYNSVIETNQQAIIRAEEIDSRVAGGNTEGDLLGIPYLVKDNILNSYTANTAASNFLGDFHSPYQSTAVERLEEAGAILLGTANMDEFGHGSSTENSFFGPTKNPHDKTRVAGGSSGGSAAAVALGLTPFTLGTDTGGSIRLPASFCGAVGYKPTYGLVSRYGVIAMASSMDVIGPLAMSVADSAQVLNVIAGDDPNDATTISREDDYRINNGVDLSSLKIGLVKEHMGEHVDEVVRENTWQKIEILRDAGATVDEVDLPNDEISLAIYYIIMPSEISSNLARYDGIKYGRSAEDAKSLLDTYLLSRAQGFGQEPTRRILTGTYALSSGYQDAYYKKAQKTRTLLRQDYDNLFKTYDVLIGPTAPTVAFRMGEKPEPVQMYLMDDMTISANLAGVPAVTVPSGNIDGVPFGMHFQAPSGQDKRLLEVASAVEEVL